MAAKPVLNVALVGYSFMGRAHSNAYHQVERFFDCPYSINKQVIVGRSQGPLAEAAANWGWAHTAASLDEALAEHDIDVVDITTPNDSHFPLAMTAIKAGKHVFCEKPLTLTAAESKKLHAAADKAGVRVGLWHNYRRAPAASLAQELISSGKIGAVRQVRGVYLQDWLSDPKAPASWRMTKAVCGSGAHGDLNAHLIDMTRFLTGLEFSEVTSLAQTFTPKRPNAAGKGQITVDVDDAFLFLAKLSNGAVASYEATRVAAGRKNYNQIEINGTKGTVVWNFERMNELQFFSFEDDAKAQGFRTIMAMDSNHPYAGNYWPDGHIIGYEHTFTNTLYDWLVAVKKKKPFYPDFADGWANQEVLEASLKSAATGRWTKVKEVPAVLGRKKTRRRTGKSQSIA